MIERQHLLLIKTIDETGSVTKAADKLYLSQSAVSHAMKKLEAQLAMQVWRKSGRQVKLTNVGVKLLSMANKLLPQFEKLEQELIAFNKGEGGLIKLGIECYPCFQWLLKFVGPYLKANPKVDVDIKNDFKFGGIGALLNYEIDLLITPDPLYQKNLNYIPIFSYQQVLVVHRAHPFANLEYVTPELMNDQVLYTYPVEQQRLDIFSKFLTPAGFSVRQHKTLENTEMLLAMVKNERGVAALPDWLAESALGEDLVMLPVGKSGISKQTFFATRANEELNPLIEAFIGFVTADQEIL